MAATAVLNSGSVHILIGGEELNNLAKGYVVALSFSLHGKVLTGECVRVQILPSMLDQFVELRHIEQNARDKAHDALPEWQPGYSNRKIRKGKGHGKG